MFNNEKSDKTQIREDVEWTRFRWHNAPDLTTPRILLIGDSIVDGHGGAVHELVKDYCCVDYYATSKCVSDVDFMVEVEYVLSRREYQLVIFNNGLHGFDIDDETYVYHLEQVLLAIKSRVEKLVWRNSTPVRDKNDLNSFDEKLNQQVIQRNELAAAVAESHAIPGIDLYAPMAERVDLYTGDAVHFNQEGRQFQADIIARYISSLFSSKS